eukprot:1075098-Prymnesium_polylepis.1
MVADGAVRASSFRGPCVKGLSCPRRVAAWLAGVRGSSTSRARTSRSSSRTTRSFTRGRRRTSRAAP